MLSFRRKNIEEDRRLDSQHEVIKHGITNGRLIDPQIPVETTEYAIADICCGTGIWLEDVVNTILFNGSAKERKSYELVGFDTNAHAFRKDLSPSIQLIEQDCTKPFDAKYHCKFDLVNMRGLAYAIPEDQFSPLVENAIQLLRPGGYLQWLETDTRLFQTHSDSPEILKALKAINLERQERKLVSYMPHFMLQSLLDLESQKDFARFPPSGNTMSILKFSLMAGGFSRAAKSDDVAVNERFSETVLETVQLLLKSALLRIKSAGGTDESADSLQGLIDLITENSKDGKIKMGGLFPLLVAQKSSAGQ
ncbi:MAG: hypothetical protein Q9227_000110 [Pyrenula ochraceoflavens]